MFDWYCSPGLTVDGLHPPAPHQVGRKAAGILRLDPHWVPPGLYLAPTESQGRLEEDAVAAVSLVPDEAILSLMSESRTRRLLVRSSAPSESMRERGSFLSVECLGARTAIVEAVKKVWQQAIETGNVSDKIRIGLIIQPLLVVKMAGHLSNEHRVSREFRQWTKTIEVPSGGHSTQWRVSLGEAMDDGPIECLSTDNLEHALRRVAAQFSSTTERFHLEWVWDGARAWIVQADVVEEHTGPAPGDAWAPTRGLVVNKEDLSAFRLFDPLAEWGHDWPKLKGVSLFAEVGLPSTNLFVLEGEHVLQELADGCVPTQVREDLRILASGHLLIRTDVKGEESEFMLPKTKATCDLQVLESFLTDTAKTLVADHGAENIAFIAHRFLRARGSVWAFARPTHGYVEIDANWGLPDGLSWLPHDSYVVESNSDSVRRSILGKTNLLDVAGDERWRYREAPSKWIWRSVLSDSEARIIADSTRALATAGQAPVLVMWFVHLLDGSTSDLLPWFMAREEPVVAQRRSRWQSQKTFTVRVRQDLHRFAELEGRGAYCMVLKPSDELIRDSSFVNDVAREAKDCGATVEIQGSPLGHAYYILRKHGVVVYTRDGDLGNRYFRKLVRDRVPKRVEDNGEYSDVYVALGDEKGQFLRQKLVEEALEVNASGSMRETLEELADVEEVVDALLDEYGLNRESLQRAQAEKQSARGGFSDGLVLMSTALSEDSSSPDPMLPGFEIRSPKRLTRRVEVADARLRLPLIPPGPLDAREEVLKLESTGQRIRVRYTGRFVEVEVLDSRSAPHRGEEPLF